MTSEINASEHTYYLRVLLGKVSFDSNSNKLIATFMHKSM